MNKPLPVWRSMLFVPVIVPRFVDGAAGRGADAIILDLEDSVPPAQKAGARGLIADAAAKVAARNADVLVRVNRPWRMLVRDIEAAVGPGVCALMLPKVESAEHVQAVAEIVAEVEAEHRLPQGHTRLLAMIETAGAVFRAEAIARSHQRLVGLTIGAEDLALSLGMAPEAETLFLPKQLGVIAARAAGVLPLGFLGTVAEFADLDAFRAVIRRSRKLGFEGAACVHPSQVAILNEEYAPGAVEVDHARRLIAAYDEAVAAQRGAVTFEGRMIDVPVVERARAVLARSAAIKARQGLRP
ncbi:MAG TPA: CoA ester lyase [Acetobacteraceae bacterium]|nr:CoA ester lyase [Acetobacteraceae bacterium]